MNSIKLHGVGHIENDVLVGKDGYLFLESGGHQVMNYVSGRLKVPPDSFLNFVDNIHRRSRAMSERGKSYIHLMFPDKHTVLPEKLPFKPEYIVGAEFQKFYPEFDENVMFPIETLTKFRDKVYRRLDTHLTSFGTILVAKAVARRFGANNHTAATDSIIQGLQPVALGSGDLGSKLDRTLDETAPCLTERPPGTWLHNSLAGGNNGIVDLRFNPLAPDKRRVLIFGDSFGRELALYLNFVFAQVVFLRTPYFHYDIVDQIDSEIVISENVERYLPACQLDDVRPSFHMFPFLGNGTYAPGKEFASAFSALLSNDRRPYAALKCLVLTPPSTPP